MSKLAVKLELGNQLIYRKLILKHCIGIVVWRRCTLAGATEIDQVRLNGQRTTAARTKDSWQIIAAIRTDIELFHARRLTQLADGRIQYRLYEFYPLVMHLNAL